MKRVTVEDIAKSVGVTKGLVSRALTGKYNVSEQMREEITRTAVNMGYDFDKLRTKSKKRSKCILVMTSSMLVKESYWQPIIRTLTSTLDQAHINLDYFIYDELDTADVVNKLKGIDASGYIFMNNNPEEIVKELEHTNRPIVVIDPKQVLSGKHLQIRYNNFSGFYDMTKMLISMGHKHFCFYGPTGESSSFTEREEGFLRCVADHEDIGVTASEVLFKNDEGSYADNKAFEEHLLKNKKITAILCANDIIAFNAIESIKRIGKKVPNDYSIAGFDNILQSSEKDKNLTTVNVPRAELGEEAAKYLINHINNKQVKYSQIVIDCEIIVRNSVQKI